MIANSVLWVLVLAGEDGNRYYRPPRRLLIRSYSMGNRCRLILILALLVPPGFSSDLMGTPVSPKVASLPAVFEKNMGQAPSSYRFLSRRSEERRVGKECRSGWWCD